MTAFESEAYIRYLSAKQSVDDRALNRAVWQALRDRLPRVSDHRPLRVIELGAGTGTMLQRVLAWHLAPHLHYTLVEMNADYLAAFNCGDAVRRQGREAPANAGSDDGTPSCITETVCADLNDVIADPRFYGRWDLVMAHAVLDLVDPGEVLPGCTRLAAPGGLLYLSLNYDGQTVLEPETDPDLERQIWERYHHSMDHRLVRGRRCGSSRSGRDTADRLAALKIPILAQGLSEWRVFAQDRRYPADEAFFLEIIIETIYRQLQSDAMIDPLRLAAWKDRRREQITAGELSLTAVNCDFLAQVPCK